LANSVEIDPIPNPQSSIRPWSSLLIRDYRLLWIASVLSSLAGQIRNVATLYQVYDISGSAFKLGLTGFLETLPFIIFGLFAGAVADAFDRKKLLIATISLQLVPNLLLGLLTLTGAIQVWHIYTLGLVGAFQLAGARRVDSTPGATAVADECHGRQYYDSANELYGRPRHRRIFDR
jgi:MFS family permease